MGNLNMHGEGIADNCCSLTKKNYLSLIVVSSS